MNGRGPEPDDRALLAVLGKYVGSVRAQQIVARVRRPPTAPLMRGRTDEAQLTARIGEALRMFVGERETQAALAELARQAPGKKPLEPIEIDLRIEADIARARGSAREVCEAIGASPLILQKLATIVSELARNIVTYAGGGRLAIRPCSGGRRCVHVEARDTGPGIPNLDEILSGRYKSRSGLGLGILGTKRLADKFAIQSGPGGTQVDVEVSY